MNILSATPYLALILFGIIFAWIFSAKSLGKLFSEKQKEMEEISLKPEKEVKKEEVSIEK